MKNAIKPTAKLLKKVESLFRSYLADCKLFLKQGYLADAQERASQILGLSKNDDSEMYSWLVDIFDCDEDVLDHNSFRKPIVNLAKEWLPKFIKEVGPRKQWKEYDEEYL